ncbi:MAG: glycosyltransferase family 39 protein, partial [Anaerolineae bacterium]
GCRRGADTHPPLYPFLLYAWLRAAGSSPLAVRFLSALIGTLTVPLVFVLGRRAFGQATGLLASLLTAVSPVLVYYSQETRMYGLVAVLGVASVYGAASILQGERRTTGWLAYFFATLAAAYTHYYAFFVILAENLVVVPALLVRRRRSDLARWLLSQAGILVAYIPWIFVQVGFLSGKASTRFDEWNLSTAWRIAAETVASFGAGLAVAPAVAQGIAVLFAIVVAVGVVALVRRRDPEPWLVVAYLFLPVGLAWLVNPVMPFFYARYLLLLAPAFYLLAAHGVLIGWRLWRPLGVAGAVLLVLASLWGLRGYYTDEAYVKGRYGQMMSHIQSHAQPGDAILLANQLQRPLYDYYAPDELAAYFLPSYEYPLEDPRTARDLEAIAARHPRLWLVRFGNPAEYDPDGYLTRWLATHGSKAYFGGWVDADLSLYVMRPATADGDIQRPLAVELGDQVRLLGYSLSAEQVAPGETLLLTLYWEAMEPMQERYTVFTHLLDADEQIQAQMDSEPQGGGLPTDRWQVGQVVQDNYALTVSPDAEPGPHVLEVGMYLLETLDRLPVRDPDSGAILGDRVLLGTVQVEE